MKQRLKHFLYRNPRFYRILKKAYKLPFARFRFVVLSWTRLSEDRLEEIKNDAGYNDIMTDLIAYTGFSEEKLTPYVLRYPEKHFESEFRWYAPKDEQELAWFYRCSSGYLFGNAVHPYVPALDIITEGKVLDYGAGIGCNTIGLAKRGIDVDFLEICRLQADFLEFRVERHKLKNVREVRPYHEGRFDPVLCITDEYDAIIAMDVLEHIPNYHVLAKHLIERLKPGGMFIEKSPFAEASAGDIGIHLRPSVPLEEAMAGMKRIDRGIWKKAS